MQLTKKISANITAFLARFKISFITDTHIKICFRNDSYRRILEEITEVPLG